jgi:hypothetical protein
VGAAQQGQAGAKARHATLQLDQSRLTWREIEGEVIVLDKRTWTYLGINPSGALLWKELAQGTTLPALVDRLCDTYGRSREEASQDADDFLSALRAHELVNVVDHE